MPEKTARAFPLRRPAKAAREMGVMTEAEEDRRVAVLAEEEKEVYVGKWKASTLEIRLRRTVTTGRRTGRGKRGRRHRGLRSGMMAEWIDWVRMGFAAC
jgi:hypothetical protein